MAASEDAARRHAEEALEYEQQLKRVVTLSLKEQRRRDSESKSELHMGLGGEGLEHLERAMMRSGKMVESAEAVPSGSRVSQPPPSYPSRHLEGTTQSEFEAQQQGRWGEETAQEMTEEDIVMAYIKKQSLLEMHHQDKGKGRATATEEEDDDDDVLQKVLELSMREHRYGEASGI
jgi:hypothetical protein